MKVKSTPLSFEIDASLASALERLRRESGGVSVSKLIDHAIDTFDYRKVSRKAGGKRRQLSVRLADDKRGSLERISKSEKVSMAHLIRLALESLMESANKTTIQKELKMAKQPKPAKKAAKKPVKKAAVKKAAKKPAKKAVKKVVKKVVKKAVKKPAAKKTVKKAAKKVAKKKPMPRKAVKKVAKKAAPAKKAAKKVVKKVAKKAAPAKKAVKKAVKKVAKKK